MHVNGGHAMVCILKVNLPLMQDSSCQGDLF